MAFRAAAVRSERMTSDPWKYHVGDSSPFWKKFREALVVNPDSVTGSAKAPEHRYPPPASRPEPYLKPGSKASDVAQNPYYLRDFRRMYPQTSVVTQSHLSQLLLSQPELLSLPPTISFGVTLSDVDSLTTSAVNQPLAHLFCPPDNSNQVRRMESLPPMPPPFGGKLAQTKPLTKAPGPRQPPHHPDAYFPVTLYT